LLCDICNGLYAKFGPQSSPPSLGVGCGVDLLAVRLMDFASVGTSAAEHSQKACAIAEETLAAFHSFLHVVRRAPEDASNGWWHEPSKSGAPAALLCLRGERLIDRFRVFLAKEWKLTAATAGDILYAPDIHIARSAYRAFFGGISEPLFDEVVARSDLRSAYRFEDVPKALQLSDEVLFPRQLQPQLAICVLLPPTIDAVLFRVLTLAEQQGFELATAKVAGGLSEEMAKLIFDQEVQDEHLQMSDRKAYLDAMGCGTRDEDDDDDDGQYRCLWLVFARHHSVKRLAQLCGHGTPEINKEFSHASLRFGRDSVENGIRCATSSSSARTMIQRLSLDIELVHPAAASGPPEERRLGVESLARSLECTLVVLAIKDEVQRSLAYLLRELHTALLERSLTLVALHAVACKVSGPEAARLGSPEGWAKLLQQQCAARSDGAAKLATLAAGGSPLLVAACEGPVAAARARTAVVAMVSAAPKGALEYYTSGTAAEGASDVACFFKELHGGKHYIVSGAC